MHLSHFARALADAEAVIELDDELGDGHHLRALALQGLGQRNEAAAAILGAMSLVLKT